jgi:hypothetical protein
MLLRTLDAMALFSNVRICTSPTIRVSVRTASGTGRLRQRRRFYTEEDLGDRQSRAGTRASA